ncbi:hypothetical protein L596_012647 [Steinernema carpocapsae]|uniref:Serpentine receptor class gamma n=1 Tax=Steinernema carpocapsae TaxID=34508 RepID=A0A4U5NYM1_STECR|nr:hypothetical protein L596_012647 [Steinernema carpocapsae]
MDVDSPPGILFLTFTAFSTLLYIYLIILILTDKELREAAFFMLNIVLGISDIGMIWTMYTFHRLTAVRKTIFLNFGKYNPFAFMCTNTFGFFHDIQKFVLMAIVVNRFTAVVFPQGHRKIWSGRYTLIIILIIILTSLAKHLILELLFPTYFYVKSENTREIGCISENKLVYKIGLQFTIYLAMFASVITCLLYGIMITYLCLNRKKMKGLDDGQRHRPRPPLRQQPLPAPLLLLSPPQKDVCALQMRQISPKT